MKEYLKLLIIITIITALTVLVMDLIFAEKINIYHTAIAGFINGVVLAFVLKKV